ncbi:hypothetical protein SJAG_02216 [Schizosaccharomyces japonicus yFS275]|uniref:Uncharacterized protein n=1 Tax=Schizosaccharomyces japonicus (strain yFS275 / FY16936) TaxID=402676 RepID=B6K1V6_SCHJY|nr:hypothetical protein SJAG_02216 [Schizosaccharomyces japonicus yFS275]EEB07137.1 hypothetical protein SJAG_02216 [Schizosaccharomyces japonicus yFS275]
MVFKLGNLKHSFKIHKKQKDLILKETVQDEKAKPTRSIKRSFSWKAMKMNKVKTFYKTVKRLVKSCFTADAFENDDVIALVRDLSRRSTKRSHQSFKARNGKDSKRRMDLVCYNPPIGLSSDTLDPFRRKTETDLENELLETEPFVDVDDDELSPTVTIHKSNDASSITIDEDLNDRSRFDETKLINGDYSMEAMMNDNNAIVKISLAYKDDVDSDFNDGFTFQHNLEATKYAIANFADVCSIKDNYVSNVFSFISTGCVPIQTLVHHVMLYDCYPAFIQESLWQGVLHFLDHLPVSKRRIDFRKLVASKRIGNIRAYFIDTHDVKSVDVLNSTARIQRNNFSCLLHLDAPMPSYANLSEDTVACQLLFHANSSYEISWLQMLYASTDSARAFPLHVYLNASNNGDIRAEDYLHYDYLDRCLFSPHPGKGVLARLASIYEKDYYNASNFLLKQNQFPTQLNDFTENGYEQQSCPEQENTDQENLQSSTAPFSVCMAQEMIRQRCWSYVLTLVN